MLPQIWERQIAQIVHDNRMLYEPQIETASDYEELKTNLKNRGFTDLPIGANLLLRMDSYGKAPIAKTSDIKSIKTMIPKPNQ
jgi:hypothetical protein